ncbi:MAG: N-acetyltransferase [Aliidongia sp.]
MIKFTTERPEHAGAIETLLDAAFGADRHAKISYSYREGVERVVPLCLVALDDGVLAATIRYWPVMIGDAPALLLGPVAVAESHRNAGLGGKLIRCSLDRARTLGYRSVLLVGDEAYYGRFGFHPASRHGIVMPHENPTRLLALSIAASNRDALPSGLVGPWRSVRRFSDAA